MAAIIHGYGTKRFMVERSILMHHPASGGVRGTLEEMQSRLGTIQRYVDKMSANIAKRSGLSLQEFKSKVVSEMWLDAEDAVASKFAEGLVTVNVDMKNRWLPVIGPTTTEEKTDKISSYEFIWK
jgi:ATP-dependent protease ClpP protease subunit